MKRTVSRNAAGLASNTTIYSGFQFLEFGGTARDTTINGGYTEAGYDGFWNGFIRNDVHGSVNLIGNTVADPDGNEVVTNTIHGNLNCQGNDPPPQVGDSAGAPNHVTGRETGQCVGL